MLERDRSLDGEARPKRMQEKRKQDLSGEWEEGKVVRSLHFLRVLLGAVGVCASVGKAVEGREGDTLVGRLWRVCSPHSPLLFPSDFKKQIQKIRV